MKVKSIIETLSLILRCLNPFENAGKYRPPPLKHNCVVFGNCIFNSLLLRNWPKVKFERNVIFVAPLYCNGENFLEPQDTQ